MRPPTSIASLGLRIDFTLAVPSRRRALALSALSLLLCAASTTQARAQAGARPVVAVFDLENRARLKNSDVLTLTEYITTRLAEGGLYRVVPKGEVQSALRSKKAESYQSCYDESCQIEIGRELAAQKTLSSKVSQLGTTCIVTVQLYDLAQGASEGAGTSKGGCKVEQILGLLDQAMASLVRPAAEAPAPVESAATPAPPPSSLPMPKRPALLYRLGTGYGELEFAAARDVAQGDGGGEKVGRAARSRQIEHLSALAADYPSFDRGDEALYALGLAYERAGDLPNARRFMFKLIKSYPASSRVPFAYLFFAEAFRRESKLDLADQAFAEASKFIAVAPYARFCRALLAADRDDRGHASSHIRNAREAAEALPASVDWRAPLLAAIDAALSP